jgi:nitrite reductase/ring-hydroxylating ferredoxin subunit
MLTWHHIALDNPLVSGERTTASIGDKEVLVCTLHGARFDLRDGCPTAGPASKPLATYPIELRDGELYVSF